MGPNTQIVHYTATASIRRQHGGGKYREVHLCLRNSQVPALPSADMCRVQRRRRDGLQMWRKQNCRPRTILKFEEVPCVGGCSTKLISMLVACQVWLQYAPHMTAAATAAGVAGAAAGSGRCRPAALLPGRRRRHCRGPGCPAAAVPTPPI
jgi:hypothetical protein